MNSVKTNSATTRKLNKLKALLEQQKTVNAQVDALKKEVIEYIGADQTLVNNDGVVLATYKPYETTRFDTKQFKEQEPELYGEYLIESTQYKFLIK